jgi:hypothetical protein
LKDFSCLETLFRIEELISYNKNKLYKLTKIIYTITKNKICWGNSMEVKPKPKPKSKPKSKAGGPLATALAWEKKSLATYQKMQADAEKKQRKMEANLFRNLRSDAEKHVKNIENTMQKIKQEEAKAKERARIEREKAAREKAAKAKAAKPPVAKPSIM